ncbi:ATP-binding protein, partial [Phocaeicola sp.]
IVLYVAFCLIRNFSNLRNRIQVETQLTEYKLMFFTNISHEFRTPLTMIQGALEKIESLNKIPQEMVYPIRLMNKSTNRMLRLINQLLEFRKMQNNKLSLMLEETDVMVFFYDIYRSFKETADDKQIDFHFAPSTSSYKMFVDQSKLDKIVYNLLSNALKYTPKGGKVVFAIIVNEEVGKLFISVSDNGVGIPKEKQGELFSRFMQSSFSHNSVGIGLHLTYELVNVHKGSISFDENEGGGSVFTVILPLDSSIYEKKDFLVSSSLQEEAFVHEQYDTYLTVNHDSVTPDPLNEKKILIIEDDGDVRKFLEMELGIYFEIISEPDGLSGLQKAQSFEVDLIICDVLMPGMSGFDVTRKLKRDFETSHIPIILLTAMGTSENKLEGVESGADAYITKPFSSKLLLARIFQLIEQREKLKRKFSKDPAMTSPALCSTELDKKFSERLQAILEKQLDNPEFTIEDFASAVGLSRAAFFRKVKGVTGYTPNEYMRILRMKRAMELLQEGIYNVSEIAYKVGMNDPLYFSKCFKSHFGAPPSAYLHKK